MHNHIGNLAPMHIPFMRQDLQAGPGARMPNFIGAFFINLKHRSCGYTSQSRSGPGIMKFFCLSRKKAKNLNSSSREVAFKNMVKVRAIGPATKQCKLSNQYFSRLFKGGIAFSPLHPRPPRLSGSRWRAGGKAEIKSKIFTPLNSLQKTVQRI